MCRNAGEELMCVGAHDTGINTGIERNLYVAFQAAEIFRRVVIQIFTNTDRQQVRYIRRIPHNC